MQALERILAILESTSRTASAVSPSEVAEETGLSFPTVVRLMQSLADSNVLVRSADTGQYRIGPRLIGVVAKATRSFDYRAAAQPHLDRLREATGETASLHVLQDRRRTCIAASYSTQPYGRIVPVGLPFPIIGSAVGHALLAQLDDAEAGQALAGLSTAEARDARKAAAEVRRQGFTTLVSRSVAGVRGIAVPVGDTPGLGCLSVSGPDSRFDETAAAKALPPLRDTVAALLELSAPSKTPPMAADAP